MPASLRSKVPSPRGGRVAAFAPARARLASLALLLAGALGCGDAHWLTLTWPSADPNTPAQPTLAAAELGLAAAVTRLDYEPEAVSLVVELDNRGPAALRIERAGILLAWDVLEYPPDPAPAGEPEWLSLGPGEAARVSLHYHLGRALTGAGVALVFRSLTRDDQAVVARPRLPLPAKPL